MLSIVLPAMERYPAGVFARMDLRVHHEYYHFIEYRLFNDFYSREPAWLALSPPGTAYGKGFQNLGHPHPGLVSLHAACGPEEDKAEVFGWMMTPAYALRLEAWMALDPALLAKRQ